MPGLTNCCDWNYRNATGRWLLTTKPTFQPICRSSGAIKNWPNTLHTPFPVLLLYILHLWENLPSLLHDPRPERHVGVHHFNQWLSLCGKVRCEVDLVIPSHILGISKLQDLVVYWSTFCRFLQGYDSNTHVHPLLHGDSKEMVGGRDFAQDVKNNRCYTNHTMLLVRKRRMVDHNSPGFQILVFKS